MRIQRGYIWRVGKSWFGRWYRDEIADGKTRRVQHSEKLVDYSDRYRSKTDVQPLLDAKLVASNEGRVSPEGTLTVGRYVEDFFLPYADAELKPSTANGYRALWKMYLSDHAGQITIRDFRCVDATNLLREIHQKHKLASITLRHCKGLLSSIFMHAKRAGVIDGINPVQDAGIPRAAKKGHVTYAYSSQEIFTMLHTFSGAARAAIGLMYFAGLRPGEARAVRWTDYDVEKGILRISASVWRTHLTTPKTEESIGAVPVAQVLADILAELPHSSEFILPTPKGRPLDLHNLAARIVSPGLQRCGICHEQKSEHAKATHPFELDKTLPEWRGWYACRRGLATVATSVDSALAAKSLLRHSNIATTNQHYIKSVSADAKRAMDKIDGLFDTSSIAGRPN